MSALNAMTEREIDETLQRGFRYAYSLTHDRAEAEDLLQEACVSILGASAPWDKAYVFTTIRNRFIDRYRRNQKVLFLPLEGERDGEMVEPRFAIEGWEAPDYLGNGQLDRALAALRPEERETIYLAVVEGYTAQEIAGMTGRPRGTILSLLHRTRQKLRRLLEGEDAAGARS
ncbi:MAG: RNA polymerase sigma factor [Thermoanaerobaculia bacterium]|nr:RNA polymerase sigma factor [Thermoanaerobaculia bacterium]